MWIKLDIDSEVDPCLGNWIDISYENKIVGEDSRY